MEKYDAQIEFAEMTWEALAYPKWHWKYWVLTWQAIKFAKKHNIDIN